MSVTRSLASSRKKTSQPFYQVPDVQTSARIIEEARRSIRVLPTSRPCTPAEPGRMLFGARGPVSRPPSVYSIGAQHFLEERSTRPNTAQKLAPIEKTMVANKAVKVKWVWFQLVCGFNVQCIYFYYWKIIFMTLSFICPHKQVDSKEKIPPPTPVQSLQDLLVFTILPSSTPATSLQRSSSDHLLKENDTSAKTCLDNASRTSLSSNESGNIELKVSHSSPALSKRSLSAGNGRRILSSTLRQDNVRVVSAGNERVSPGPPLTGKDEAITSESGVPVSSGQQTSDKGSVSQRKERTKSHDSSSKRRQSRHDDSHKSSSSSVDVPFWESEVVPLLQKLDSTPYDSASQLCETCDLLWSSLSTHSLLGRTGGVGGTKKRGKVLRTVFRLLDHKNPLVLLKVARIILAVSLPSHWAHACA